MAGEARNEVKRKYAHVAVLMGGWSAEREISLKSGRACAAALGTAGYEVSEIDVQRDIAEQLARLRPDACFNALHGRWGEDGCVQGILECMGIPYTHSGVLASALAMHKGRARDVLAKAGVPVAEGRQVAREDAARSHVMAPPYVAKPICEGSSVGVVVVREGANTPPEAIANIAALDGEILVERFIAGRELTCGVIDGRATRVIEIVPAAAGAFYDFEAKYAPGGSRHILPAQLPDETTERIRMLALAAHNALGCKGVSRADFRLDDRPVGTGMLACLEVNTQPGMTETSLVPELAADLGMSFIDLVSWIVEDASVER
ncbi:MAG: hypothetical protein RLZ98_3553 [Pseudomonadota bacterium]|jgi:D-alanine-D-alanine ligase